ncbi:MAG: hypothetical protein WC539_07210 [Nitrospirota bacterium]
MTKKYLAGIGIIMIACMFFFTAGASADDWNPAVTSNVESFQVDGFTGAGSYAIPIPAPKAIGGMMPSIALTYSTQQIDDGGRIDSQ